MPKTGLSHSEWEERLRGLANKTFLFRRGQRPPPGSTVAKKVKTVESCPSHVSLRGKDIFGRDIVCTCGYHQQQEQVIRHITIAKLLIYI